MQFDTAKCPHCRAKLGLRTTFGLTDLWDPRTAGPIGLKPEFLCYQCGRPLGYPINTALSFIALAILPLLIAGSLGLRGETLSSVGLLLAPYLVTLGMVYSYLATPILIEEIRPRRKR